jgi:hypothetical protein
MGVPQPYLAILVAGISIADVGAASSISPASMTSSMAYSNRALRLMATVFFSTMVR